jgi:2-oxo-3-hexenedioate decarboxylase
VRGERLKPGDIVTTGTVTRAFPIRAGETWQSEIVGLPLEGLTVRFR